MDRRNATRSDVKSVVAVPDLNSSSTAHASEDEGATFAPYHIADEKQKTATLLRWAWTTYIRRHWLRLSCAALFMVVQGSMLGLLSYLIKPMFDDVLLTGERSTLLIVGLLIMGIFCLRGLSGFAQRVIMSAVSTRVNLNLQRDLMHHILTLDTMFFEANPPGNLMARVLGDSNSMQAVWSDLFSPAFRDTISLISLALVAITIDWVWTLVVLAGIPLLIVPLYVVQQLARRYSQIQTRAGANMSVRLDEIFHGIRAIKFNIQEARQTGRFLETALLGRRATIRNSASQASVPFMVDVIAGLGFFGFLVLAGNEVIDGEKTIGQFMSFFTAVVLIFDPLKRLGGLATGWQTLKVSLERVHAIMRATPRVRSPARPVPPPAFDKALDVEFQSVRFSFEPGEPLIEDLSFVAHAGRTTALVGPSGTGKTTVFNLLTRIIDPQSGTITIGGQPTGSMEISKLRSLFAVVAQDAGIFDESIRENILLGRQSADPDEVHAAAQAAYVNEFADHMPQGLDSPCGPRGSNLSGGQRQRVAIARALLRDAPILLLDEPTSALDSQSEALVQKAIDALSVKRSILVIAHRLSTIRDADKIIMMQNGRVGEEGTHHDLLALKGAYASLHDAQFR